MANNLPLLPREEAIVGREVKWQPDRRRLWAPRYSLTPDLISAPW